jgi:hypothetical protein
MALNADVHPSEAEDFENEVRRAKRSMDEFEITSTPQEPLTRRSGVISPLSGSITIKNKKTGAERVYRTGHVSGWVMEAIADIKAGAL